MQEKGFIKKLQKGNEEAFRRLVEEHHVMVFRVCLRYVGNQEDARDMAQDVFVEALRSVKHFRSESSINTWLYRIAVNKSLNFIKKHKRRSLTDDISQFMKEAHADGDASTETINNERRRVLATALDALSENQKEAFTLHKIEGKSYKEIAELTGSSLSSVESLIHRAKQNLQQKLLSYYKERY